MTNGILRLGRGRLSGACLVDGENVIVVRRGGVLYKIRLLSGRKIEDDGVVGYGNDCYIFPFCRLFMDAEVKYDV